MFSPPFSTPPHVVLANVGLGLCFSAYGRFKISPAVLHDLHGLCVWCKGLTAVVCGCHPTHCMQACGSFWHLPETLSSSGYRALLLGNSDQPKRVSHTQHTHTHTHTHTTHTHTHTHTPTPLINVGTSSCFVANFSKTLISGRIRCIYHQRTVDQQTN